jgi:hypothetical protein
MVEQLRVLTRIDVDGAELAGSQTIFAPLIGQTLQKRLDETLIRLPEYSVLAVDFGKIGVVDSSTLMIAIAQPLSLCQRRRWQKTMVCCGTTPMHQVSLAMAITHYPYTHESRNQAKRLLLLASDRQSPVIWRLLGDLNDTERMLWEHIIGMNGATASQLESDLALGEHNLLSHMRVFLDTGVLRSFEMEGKMHFVPVHKLPVVSPKGDL